MDTNQDNSSADKQNGHFDIIPIIAHQIRSPLATIRLSNQTLLENAEHNLTERQIYLLEQANKRANRIYELTEELLKADEDSMLVREPDLTESSLEDLCDALLDEMNVSIQAKDLQIVRAYDEDARPFSFDSSLLADALTNLLDNAVSYTPEGGTVTVGTQYSESEVTLTVSDTGPGIQSSEVDKLFKKFSRLAGGMEHRRDGLGLGLHIAKRAIERHGGRIWYEPNEPYGSSFMCTLPIKSE